MTERKLVQAFKGFIEKSVLPLNTTNEVLLNDWKHLNNIISADPIDPNQLDFYLYVINKQPTNSPTYSKVPPQRQTTGNISEFGKFPKRSNQFNIGIGSQAANQIATNSDKGSNTLISEKKSMTSSTTSASRRKNLLANLQNFQSLLIKNQQRLQNYTKTSSGIKETTSGFNTSITSNGGTKKYY